MKISGTILMSLIVIVSGLACAEYGPGMKLAYGQTSDNSSDLGVPTDNPAADLGLDNSTNSSSGSTPAGSASGTVTSSTPAVTTPEFGSIAPIILVIAVISIVIISARTRLGFG